MKRILKAILPMPLRLALREVWLKGHQAIFGQDARYKGKTNAAVFDDGYAAGIWGKDAAGAPVSGMGSHESDATQPYIDVVKKLLEEKAPEVIVDLGCGDFNVGRHFVGDCSRYMACDVSALILEQNRQKYAFSNVEFRGLDLSHDDLPGGDMAFVRQVLQHLSNADIANFVHKLNETKPYKHLLVTEHLPATASFEANLDKPSGPGIRFPMASGVELHKPPFNLRAKRQSVVHDVLQGKGKTASIIRTTLYEF